MTLPVPLKGLSLDELRAFVESLDEPPYRANQLFSWIYEKGASSFDEMSDISRPFREILKQRASIDPLRVITTSASATDGTKKFLFRLHDGLAVESVLIPPEPTAPDADKRLTLCLSTQVGCPLDCKFCATGTMGFTRNLTAGEIVDQVIQAQRLSPQRISNLVYMGMGEPMLNYDQVMKSVELLTDDRSLNIGARHITISTAGYADRIRRMGDERRRVKLALSLHSLDEAKRTLLMPITKKFSVAELLKALRYYYDRTQSRPTFEYIVFEGFNDAPDDVRRIVRVARDLPCKVNLIPFHSIAFTHPTGFAADLKPASRARLEAFADALRQQQVTVMIRSSAGEDINAACGQLATTEAGRPRTMPAQPVPLS